MRHVSKLLFVSLFLWVLGCTNLPTQEVSYLRTPTAETASGLPAWSYDPGPNPNDQMGRILIDLHARIPNYPAVSQAILGTQKFRPAYGPIPWRMLQKPNSIKILFIGQDGTHIAEAAGRPATAGFGGRAQDLAKYFGVSSTAAFINAFTFTIKGQYGSFDVPIVKTKADGSKDMMQSSYVDNQLWMMSQDPSSPIVQWRNDLIEWIIRNNKDSLKMIVLFGGAARDTAANFVISHGGKAGSRFSEEDLATIKVPEMQLVSAGGNNEAPVLFNKTGGDLYADILGKKMNYKLPEGADESKSDLNLAIKALTQDVESSSSKWYSQMVFSNGGISKSGLVNPAQLGGYDINNKMEINGHKTISLKGLQLKGRPEFFKDDYVINQDVLVVQLPHPTALSMMKPAQAAEKVAQGVKSLKPYVDAGWTIAADPGFTNNFAAGEPYKYGRAQIGPEYYDFGAPASRMVAVSTASRLNASTIIFGTRDRANFDKKLLEQMTNATPSPGPSAEELWTSRPRTLKTRYIFDPGPGDKYAQLMKNNLPSELVDDPRRASNRDFGHYRGTFIKPRVLIVADPDGYDDLITARALTGTRGQYLQGLMTDLGVNDQYLVLKTAPFGVNPDDATDWAQVLEGTKKYREVLLKSILADGRPELILVDGPDAIKEVQRILGDKAPCPVVQIHRTGSSNDSGINQAAEQIKKAVPSFASANISGKMLDIPRSHLSYYARVWEGTSGDRVITSLDAKYSNDAFAEVAPAWASNQDAGMSKHDQTMVQKMIDQHTILGIRKGNQKITEFLGNQ